MPEDAPTDALASLTDTDQVALRLFFRHHFEKRSPFNASNGLRVTRWDGDFAAVELDLRPDLTAHTDVFHGGLVAYLLDVAGTAAIFAGHDYRKGSRITTQTLSVNYVSAAPGEGLVGEAHCTRRGRSSHFAEMHAYGRDSRKLVAHGVLSANSQGVRDGFDRILAAARSGDYSLADAGGRAEIRTENGTATA